MSGTRSKVENNGFSPRRNTHGVAALAFLLPSIFFLYYTVRLVYVNLTMADAAEHRTGGMLIGAVAFPVAAIVFGTISWFCYRRFRA
ncbi:MAG: hypothetical protein AB7Q37_11405 [Pyrinomonadaceae bacterium]